MNMYYYSFHYFNDTKSWPEKEGVAYSNEMSASHIQTKISVSHIQTKLAVASGNNFFWRRSNHPNLIPLSKCFGILMSVRDVTYIIVPVFRWIIFVNWMDFNCKEVLIIRMLFHLGIGWLQKDELPKIKYVPNSMHVSILK